jgi:hypothetical protein
MNKFHPRRSVANGMIVDGWMDGWMDGCISSKEGYSTIINLQKLLT